MRLKHFLIPGLIPLLFTACFSKREVVSIDNIALGNINYSLASEYNASDSLITVTLYLGTEHQDQQKVVTVSKNDTLLISGIPFQFDGQRYVAQLPAQSHTCNFYLKLKDTLCFQTSYTLPYFSSFGFDIHDGHHLMKTFRIQYKPALEDTEKIRFEVPNSKRPAHDIYFSGQPRTDTRKNNIGRFYPGTADSSDVIELQITSIESTTPNTAVRLRVEKSKEGTTQNQRLSLRYSFKVVELDENIWSTMRKNNQPH